MYTQFNESHLPFQISIVFPLMITLFFFFGLLVSWWALGALPWDKITRHPLSSRSQMIRFMLALAGALLWDTFAALLLIMMQWMRTL
ncbi:DUF1146 family protein [Alicyclobacillus tolerans]|uniref:Membrane protein YwzB n=2 Tax=Alicyclobacillus tolerans TaxID=90970 RepID=A0ABT9LU06_9BACL|nr:MULTISPECIES: DUF1146 family protein [Alicyclobacillus]MDP9727743.1 putative membrane protein YwzB [Alicyclobacillus tengchongensis]QRF24427.1 DUF1146 domain-containing protein [Alicyclobacillus sp. TC]SHK54895.1 Protein of unknown function [Alicyclobacillus montanus]